MEAWEPVVQGLWGMLKEDLMHDEYEAEDKRFMEMHYVRRWKKGIWGGERCNPFLLLAMMGYMWFLSLLEMVWVVLFDRLPHWE